MNYTHVVAVPGQLHIIDAIDPNTGRTWWGEAEIEEVLAKTPGATVMTKEEWNTAATAAACTEPTEVDAERWDYLLNVLPPLNWRGGIETETFMLSEYTSGCVTLCAIRIGDRYWTAHRPASSTHAELVALVADLAKT